MVVETSKTWSGISHSHAVMNIDEIILKIDRAELSESSDM